MAKKKNGVVAEKLPRPNEVEGATIEVLTGCGKIYITRNSIDGKLFEVFARMGKAGGCAASQTEAIGRLVSLALRYSIPPEEVIQQLQGISCHLPSGIGPNKITSCADAVAHALRVSLGIERPEGIGPVGGPEKKDEAGPGACPECGSQIIHAGGCEECASKCGWTRCG